MIIQQLQSGVKTRNTIYAETDMYMFLKERINKKLYAVQYGVM